MPSPHCKPGKSTPVLPARTEEFRAKYEVMGYMWPLAQLRQPGRTVFSDLERSTFQKFLKQLPRQAGFQFTQRNPRYPALTTVLGALLVLRFELRKVACKQCRETNIGIKAARWNAYNNQQHRMMHWLQLVSLTNSRPSSSSSSGLAKVQRELADLRNEVRRRSRTLVPKLKARSAAAAPRRDTVPCPIRGHARWPESIRPDQDRTSQ